MRFLEWVPSAEHQQLGSGDALPGYFGRLCTDCEPGHRAHGGRCIPCTEIRNISPAWLVILDLRWQNCVFVSFFTCSRRSDPSTVKIWDTCLLVWRYSKAEANVHFLNFRHCLLLFWMEIPETEVMPCCHRSGLFGIMRYCHGTASWCCCVGCQARQVCHVPN